MNTTTYPFGPDREDRDLARVRADLRALPSISRAARVGTLRTLRQRLQHLLPGHHTTPAACG